MRGGGDCRDRGRGRSVLEEERGRKDKRGLSERESVGVLRGGGGWGGGRSERGGLERVGRRV